MMAADETTAVKRRAEILIEILRYACESAANSYEDYYRTFIALDGKAQSTAMVAGIALAAVVGFVKLENVQALIAVSGQWANWLLLLPCTFALVTVVLSVLAAKITMMIVAPYDATVQFGEIRDLQNLPSEEISKEKLMNFFTRRMEDWQQVVTSIEIAVRRKGRLVLAAQVSLILTLLFLLFLMLTLVQSITR